MGDLFYHLGTVVGSIGSPVSGKAGAAAVEPPPEGPDVEAEIGAAREAAGESDPADALGHAGSLVAGAAGAWVASRMLTPRPVSWVRVVIAGVVATVLADLADRTLDTGRPRDRPPLTDDPEALLRRLGAGVAVAAGYASLLYPRLPGPPLLRGLAFGALEVATAPRGGLVGLATETPGLRFPLQPLAAPMDQDASPIARMAFGVGLGLFYRHGGRLDDADDADTADAGADADDDGSD